MKIDEALLIFYKLNNSTTNKAESKIYDKFITILLDLQIRDFTSNQKKEIETQLLTLQIENNLYPSKKSLNKKLSTFECFLTNKFSIISKNHYVNIGMALWLFSSIILFYCFGQFSVIGALLVAIIFGMVLDTEARGQGRVIKMVVNQLEPFSIDPLILGTFEEAEKPQKNSGKELQDYRKKKLLNFNTEKGIVTEVDLKKHPY